MNYTRFLIGFLASLLYMGFRFFLPIPGIELITGALFFAASSRLAYLRACFFVAVNIIAFDVITAGLNVWTFGVIAGYFLVAAIFYNVRGGSLGLIVMTTILVTLLYDAMTGLILGPLFFNQPFMLAVLGQIPFTIIHLISNVCIILGCEVMRHWIDKIRTNTWAKFDVMQNQEMGYEASDA